MTKTSRAVLFTFLLAAVALTVAVSTGASLAGKKEARAILDRSAAFYAQLQSVRLTMEVRMEMPEGFSGMPGMGPERYAFAMARPRSLSVIPVGDHPGASFIQNDEQAWIAKGERPWLMRHRTKAPEAPKMPDKDESGTMVVSFMPGFDIHFGEWEADPDLAGAFEIRPREGFTQADTLYPPPEEMGALMGSMGGFDGDHPSVGKPAPEVSIRPVDGEAVALSSLKGKVVVLDDGGVIASAYGVGALPHLVVIDSEGTVRHVHLGSGPGTEQRLETELDALLSE